MRSAAAKLPSQAGISYQTLYNHYSSQAQIYAALLREKSAPLSLQLDLEVKNYEQDLAATFAAIDAQRLAHITAADKPIWQFIANNMHTNVESTAHGEGTEETSVISECWTRKCTSERTACCIWLKAWGLYANAN